MTSTASDILSVYFLQIQAKIKNFLRVVPLFETLDDLKNANSVMKNLFKLSWYRKMTSAKQEVMIGYSDSSKDAGKLSAKGTIKEKERGKYFIPSPSYLHEGILAVSYTHLTLPTRLLV